MRKLLSLIAGMIFLTFAGLAQQVVILPMTVPPFISGAPSGINSEKGSISKVPDSTSLLKDLPLNTENNTNSVFNICWVTNSINSGWKITDSLLIGAGLEECDTAYPFIMPVTGKLWRGCSYYHSGWDIGLNQGDPVKAAVGGIVRYARYCSGYGNLVIIRHFSGMEIYYAHLSKIKVSPNQWVNAGDIVGLGGATGRARGTHLHMEFRLCDRALNIADYYVQDDTVVDLYGIIEFVSAQSKPQSTEYYTVVRGDNLSKIAGHHGTTVANLCSLNNISRNSILRIGQRLRIR